ARRAPGSAAGIPPDARFHPRGGGRTVPAPAARGAAGPAPAPVGSPGGPRSEVAGPRARPTRSADRPPPPAGPAAVAARRSPFGGPRSSRPLLLPDTADQAEPALDRAQAAAELGGDLLVAIALHLEQSDATKLGAVQAPEQPAAFLGHLRGEGGRRLRAFDQFQRPFPGGRVRGAGQ